MSAVVGEGVPLTATVNGDGTQLAAYTLPLQGRFVVESVVADVDASLAGAVNPLLRLRDKSGAVIATKRQGTPIPAGSTGSATWALRLADDGVTAPPGPGSELDYVQSLVQTVITTEITPATAKVILTGNVIALDGATRVKVEFWSSVAQADRIWTIGLFDNGVLVCTYMQNATEATPVPGLVLGVNPYGAIFLTPPAGNHQYSARAWNVFNTDLTIIGGFNALPGKPAPTWLRVTRA